MTVLPAFGPTTRPGALVRDPAGHVRAVVLVLHGGKERSTAASRTTHLSVVRVGVLAAALHRALRAEGVAVWFVRYRFRGWNGPDASPLADTRDALAAALRQYGAVPVVLVGHSMGGRVAVRLAGDEQVAGVVALAPWVPPGEPVPVLGRRLLRIVHGDRDRVTSPRASAALAASAAEGGADVRSVVLRGAGHAMLRRLPRWHALAVYFTRECLAVADAGARAPTLEL